MSESELDPVLPPSELQPVEFNPYAPPRAPLHEAAVVAYDDAEVARRSHLGFETLVKLVSAACFAWAFLFLAMAALSFLAREDIDRDNTKIAEEVGALVGGLLFGSPFIALSNGLKGLKSWARWTTVSLAPLMLLFSLPVLQIGLRAGSFVFATAGALASLVCPFAVIALLIPGVSAVFTPRYRAAVAATPRIRPWSEIVLRVVSYFFLSVIGVVLLLILTQLKL